MIKRIENSAGVGVKLHDHIRWVLAGQNLGFVCFELDADAEGDLAFELSADVLGREK